MTTRQRSPLIRRLRAVLQATGVVLFIAAGTLLLPLLAVPFAPGEAQFVLAFLIPAVMAGLGGVYLIRGPGGSGHRGLNVEDSSVVVVLGWAFTIAVSALPFLLGGLVPGLAAMFESVSGWTTTGLSVLNPDETPRVFLLWRSVMQWFGGLGFAVLMASAVLGPWAFGLYQAEGRTELLLPHIKRTTKLILGIYLTLTAAGTLGYLLAGMGWFDAINHAMCALSTGGFSTRASSIGDFNSVGVEVVTIALMAAGTTNYGVLFLLLRRRFRQAWQHGEVRILFAGLLLAAAMLRMILRGTGRVIAFQAMSALSTSGFSTASFGTWSDGALLVIVLAMLVGGHVNATAGGLKQYRVYLALKALSWQIRRLLSPRDAVTSLSIWQMGERRSVSQAEVTNNNAYILLYLLTYGLGVLALTSMGYSLRDSAFEFASSLSTVGLSVGITGIHSPPGLLAVEIVGMILGRLEFLVVFAGIAKAGSALPQLLRPARR